MRISYTNCSDCTTCGIKKRRRERERQKAFPIRKNINEENQINNIPVHSDILIAPGKGVDFDPGQNKHVG